MVSIAGTGAGAAASADVELNFTGWASLSEPVSFGACVLGSAGIGLTITVDPKAKTAAVSAGACPSAFAVGSPGLGGEANVTRMMCVFVDGEQFHHCHAN